MAATTAQPRDTQHDLLPLNAPVRCGRQGDIGRYRGFARCDDGDLRVHRVRFGDRTYYEAEANLAPLFRLVDAGGLLRRFEPITAWDDITEAVEHGWTGYA